MCIVNGKNHWPQDIEWAIEQLPGFKAGDIAALAITTPGGEEAPAVLVQCRTSDMAERARLRDAIRDKVRAITGMSCVVELVPPRTLPRTSSGKLSRSKARNLYLSGEIQPLDVAARSEEHTSELQSLMRSSYAVFCLKNKKQEANIH